MLFLLSLALATLPILGIGFLFLTNPEMSVDNLFTSIMLLTISGIFGIDVLLSLKENHWKPPLHRPSGGAASAAAGGISTTASGALMESGVVDSVGYFEARVGQPNRFVLTLRESGAQPRMLVFNGDLRDQFPVGRRVAITYRKEPEANTLLERRYV
jgi:hypothetical protein